ncbi:hypothetical protein MLD38_028168 [Melastoma candidum]|uniref:Uncharacterized protein n=1 Tax=Melastoma candidum TaxID=119954 RepID=A0ACB9N688_9MYRT|nr:hypothetical protein MLD38_028168 [Melastoma candidum]
MAGLLFWDYEDYGYSVFMYYTEWTFGLVMIYFAVGSVVSAYGCWLYYFPSPYLETIANGFSRQDMEDGANGPTITYREEEINGAKLMQLYTQKQILERAGFWGYLMQIVFQAAAGAVVFTDIIFWCLIVPFLSTVRLGLNPLMGCMHTMNAFFMLLDTSLNSLSFPWFRISYFVLWTAIYVIVQWVIHACGYTSWPYPFLVLSTPWAPLWYFCLAVISLPCYVIYALIVRAKYNLFPKWFHQSFVKIC